MNARSRNMLLIGQALYYLITALWPLFHIESFMAVSGCKTDLWLVKTVSVLILCIALALLLDTYLKEISSAITLLAFSSTIGFIAIDVYYSLNDVISQVYLADAFIQFILFTFWCLWLLSGLKGRFYK